jgi:uncharacterized protein YcbX
MAELATVTELRSYPVRSMDGSAVSSAEVTLDGLAGDRAWSVVDADGQVVSARSAPVLSEVRVAVGPDGPVLDLPEAAGRLTVAGVEADAALSAYVGLPVHLASTEGRRAGVAPVHLVSRQAVAAAIGTTSDDPACDIEAPRANITVDLGDEPPAGLERAWVGQDVVIGDVVLRVTRIPKNCLGVYADVVTPGRINLGDAVQPRG